MRIALDFKLIVRRNGLFKFENKSSNESIKLLDKSINFNCCFLNKEKFSIVFKELFEHLNSFNSDNCSFNINLFKY